MRFKKGDLVRVKEDLVVGGGYYLGFATRMKKFRGKVMKIRYVEENEKYYKLKNADGWCFSEEMIEPVKNTIRRVE